MPQTARAHVVMPAELIKEIDEVVGGRNRSRFVAEAAAEKLARLKRLRAFEKFAGFIQDGEVPEWDTKESTIEWVRALRRSGRQIPAGQDWWE